jgi:hypothetical protein
MAALMSHLPVAKQARNQLPLHPASEVIDLSEYRRRRADFPAGWPQGESGQKLEEMAQWGFQHQIEAGRPDTLQAARVRALRMMQSLQAHFAGGSR